MPSCVQTNIKSVPLICQGTSKLDSENQPIPTYTNDDIMSFSRAWTGFDLQQWRGNTEGKTNYLDPMKVQAQWRDRFPKTNLLEG